MKKTSIIILAYKEPEKFKRMFETLLKTTHQKVTPFEIIVIGNNCDPEIRDFLETCDAGENSTLDDYTVYLNFRNLGTSKGFNQGGKVAKGHYICFFNSDYYMKDNWLESMIECFEHQDKIGLISCATNATGNKDEKFRLEDLPNDYKESECAIAQMFTTRKIWEEVKGFNEDLFPVEFEDLDFNERIKEKGYKIFVNRKTYGYHDMDESKSDTRKESRERNRKIFYEKWGRNYTWA